MASLPALISAQLTEETLRARIDAAKEDGHAEALVEAADAARFMRHFDEASELLELASEAIANAQFDALWSRISLELASGGGVNGAQRALRETRSNRDIPPLEMAYWVNNFPILLVGGEFDGMIERFSADSEDPNYQCACYDRKAWMHRVAGNQEMARIYWDSLVVFQEMNPSDSDDPDVLAEFQGQLARNYARAGREEDARRTLAGAMQMPVTEEAMPTVRRRWAQAYAELGDVEHAVEHLEYLLTNPSLVTVHTLEARLSWEPIREERAFRALLERHR
jgi:tetratricopeptide (TPR) repeat protein